MNKTLIIIDPQNDFVLPTGSLSVSGANDDMDRLVNVINKFDNIMVTLDSHTPHQIFHTSFWVDVNGNQPSPYTQITLDDFNNGIYKLNTNNPNDYYKVRGYLEKLERNGKFPLIIWPYHCIIGTEGHNIYKPLSDALITWEKNTKNQVQYFIKGTDPYREMYSALKPEVGKSNDELFNAKFGREFGNCVCSGEVYFAGEALSHCLANTVTDLLSTYLGTADNLYKNVNILIDATSNVSGFEEAGNKFITKMQDSNVNIKKTTDV